MNASTLSPADSPARTYPSQDGEPESPESGPASGPNTDASSVNWNPIGSSSKTSECYSIEEWKQSWPTSMLSGTMRNSMLYPLPEWEPPTDGIESGSLDTLDPWATPTTRDYKDSGNVSEVPVNGLLGRQVKHFAGRTRQSGCVHPEFHLWLMGYPKRWNDCRAQVTPSSHKSQRP